MKVKIPILAIALIFGLVQNVNAFVPFSNAGSNSISNLAISVDSLGYPDLTTNYFSSSSSTWMGFGGGIGLPSAVLSMTTDAEGVVHVGLDDGSVQKWNGTDWEIVGPNLGLFGWTRSLIFDPLGDLYAGGQVMLDNGTYVGFAKWDGSSWTEVPLSTNYEASSTVLYGDSLIVGSNYGFGIGSKILIKEGSNWTTIYDASAASVRSIAVDKNGSVYASIYQSLIEESLVLKWNGTVWAVMGNPIDVYNVEYGPLAIQGDDIYVVENNLSNGSNSSILRWSGSDWESVEGESNGRIRSLVFHGDELFIGGDFTEMDNLAANRVAKWDGSSWSPIGQGMSSSSVNVLHSDKENYIYAGGNFGSADGNIADFAAFLEAPLPVELRGLSATWTGQKVKLEWDTLSESNNAGFVVQHEEIKDSNSWEDVDFVNGFGTTLETRSYSYEISDLSPGVHRFRLKQVDFDGSTSISSVVEARIDLPGIYFMSEVYPNPFTSSFKTPAKVDVSVASDQEVNLSIYDLQGRKVDTIFEGVLEANRARGFTIANNSLSSGNYILKFAGESFAQTKQLIVIK